MMRDAWHWFRRWWDAWRVDLFWMTVTIIIVVQMELGDWRGAAKTGACAAIGAAIAHGFRRFFRWRARRRARAMGLPAAVSVGRSVTLDEEQRDGVRRIAQDHGVTSIEIVRARRPWSKPIAIPLRPVAKLEDDRE